MSEHGYQGSSDYKAGGYSGAVTARNMSHPMAAWTKPPALLFLTSDPDLEFTASSCAKLIGYAFILGRTPEDGARLLKQNISVLSAVVIDLDNCKDGAAWIAAMESLSRKIPAIAASSLNPRFLQPMAQRHGVEYWICKPVRVDQLDGAIRAISQADRYD